MYFISFISTKLEQLIICVAIFQIQCVKGFWTLGTMYCGLMMPYGDRDVGQHWLRWWLVAWQHQAITWTNVDWSSVKSSDIHIGAISQEMPQPSVTKIRSKIFIQYLKFHSKFPGANELMVCTLVCLKNWHVLWFTLMYICLFTRF